MREAEEAIKKILKLKEEKNAAILAHNYQRPEIQDIADFVGDSFELARKAHGLSTDLIVMCGVDFMAEMVYILNPEKRILIPDLGARCPLAAQLEVAEIAKAKENHPNAKVCLYVNTSAEAKAHADICCTSANAVKVVNSLDSEEVIFGPDENLAMYVQKRVKKRILPVPAHGYCIVHKRILKDYVGKIKEAHPNALLLVHPECNPELQEMADLVASTGGMVRFCAENNGKEFIIATEKGIIHRLKKVSPKSIFYSANENAVCSTMKRITLQKLARALEDEIFGVKVQEETAKKARRALERMCEIK
ncbi:MAG: quinolinate synthase NadA [Candidatus Micrarchaeia archaeon]